MSVTTCARLKVVRFKRMVLESMLTRVSKSLIIRFNRSISLLISVRNSVRMPASMSG